MDRLWRFRRIRICSRAAAVRLGPIAAAGALLWSLLPASPATAGAVFDRVREAGVLRCGLQAPLPGLALRNEGGTWRGFDVDLCRAVAAAVLGEGGRTELSPRSGESGRRALREGRLDLLMHEASPARPGTDHGTRFTTQSLIDGQGLLVARKANLVNAFALDGATVCIGADESHHETLQRFAAVSEITLTPLGSGDRAGLVAAFLEGRCQAISAGRFSLALLRLQALPDPAAYEILPDLLSLEPLSPVVPAGDREWLSLVRWTLFALITAEELGITSANAKRLRRHNDDPRIQRLLGSVEGLGAGLGLDDAWAFRAILAAGNYGELYDRHLGSGSDLKLERGPNALWLDGGMLHAPPFR